jgi:hypothetical protein
MSGTVVVRDPDATPTPTQSATPTPTPGGTATPTPTASPTPTATPGEAPAPKPAPDQPPKPDPTGGGDQAAAAFGVKARAKRFCVRGCKHPGVVLVVDLEGSDRATLRGTLRRIAGGKARRFGTLRLRAKPGRHKVRFLKTRAGKRLEPGRYVLRLKAPGGEAHEVRFRVTRG